MSFEKLSNWFEAIQAILNYLKNYSSVKPFIKKYIEYFLNNEHPTSKYIKKYFASIPFVIQFMYLLTRHRDEPSSETIDGHGNPIDGFSPGLWRFYFLVVDGSAPVRDGIKILWRVRMDP